MHLTASDAAPALGVGAQSLLNLQQAWVLLSELACLAPQFIEKDTTGSDKGIGRESSQVLLALALKLETEFLSY